MEKRLEKMTEKDAKTGFDHLRSHWKRLGLEIIGSMFGCVIYIYIYLIIYVYMYIPLKLYIYIYIYMFLFDLSNTMMFE